MILPRVRLNAADHLEDPYTYLLELQRTDSEAGEVTHRFSEHIFWRERIRVDAEIAVFARVGQSPLLLGKVSTTKSCLRSSHLDCLVVDVKKYEDIGSTMPPPHIRDEGMILGDMPGIIAHSAQRGDQRAFTRGACSDNGDPKIALIFR